MRRCCAGDSMMVLIVFPLYADSDSDCKFERDIQEATKRSRMTEGVHLVHPTPCGDVINCNVHVAPAQSATELDPDLQRISFASHTSLRMYL